MIENINGVKNPLTIIAIFAGLAEVSGTGILPFIAEGNQATYIWFLMLFPVFLVSIFFVTLNFNPRVLYAPSDFRDEKNYMEIFRPSSTKEKLEKLEEEIQDQIPIENSEQQTQTINVHSAYHEHRTIASKDNLIKLMQSDPRSRYMLTENLIIDRLSTEFSLPPKREVVLKNNFGSFLFDAVFEDKNNIVVVEVKNVSVRTPIKRMRETLTKIQSSILALPVETHKKARLLLAIAYDLPDQKAEEVKSELKSMILDFKFPVELRMYEISELIENAMKNSEPGA